MPQVTLSASPNGLLINIFVGVSVPRQAALIRAGQVVPGAISVCALVDTGASCTLIDKTVLAPLAIPSLGAIPIHTPSTGQQPKMCDQYDVAIGIPGHVSGSLIHVAQVLPIIESDFSAQAGTFQALLGMDILRRGILIFNGEADQFTLTF